MTSTLRGESSAVSQAIRKDFATVVTLTLNLMSQVLLVGLLLIVLFAINVRLTPCSSLTIAPFIMFWQRLDSEGLARQLDKSDTAGAGRQSTPICRRL